MTTAVSADAPAGAGVRRVLVRSGGTALTDRVVAALGDRHLVRVEHAGVEAVAEERAADEIAECDVVVELGAGDHDAMARRRRSATVAAHRLVEMADAVGARQVVLVSSAMVYGAAPNNPVPLTEDAVLRPDPRFVYARQLATAELLVDRWRRADPERIAAVLRPVIPMAADGSSSLARALAAGFGHRIADEGPGSQFVHLDDVASAVVVAVDAALDGVFNVAPDGWIPGRRLLALTGETWRIPLPDRAAEVIEGLRWRFQRGPIPPGLRSYTRSPWLVANDKLRARGWRPTVTNEQVYVEGTEGRWWTAVTPKRRQELALGGVLALLVAAAAVGFTVLVRWRRGPRRRS